MPQIAQIAKKIDETNLREFETSSKEVVKGKLLPHALTILASAKQLLAGILTACDLSFQAGDSTAKANQTSSFELELDAAVQDRSPTIQVVEDVAFLVQLELSQQRDSLLQLQQQANGSLETVLCECDRALRRTRKGLGAIDLTLARVTFLPATLDFSSELQQSLQVRAEYARFRKQLRGLESGRYAEMIPRLRAAGTELAILVGRNAYPLFRMRDRLQLRELQFRILEWLRTPEKEQLAAERLWQDLFGYVEMLRQINRRQELLQHDNELLQWLQSELDRTAGVLTVGARLRLRELYGFSDELDDVLDTALVPRVENLQRMLQSFLERFATNP